MFVLVSFSINAFIRVLISVFSSSVSLIFRISEYGFSDR